MTCEAFYRTLTRNSIFIELFVCFSKIIALCSCISFNIKCFYSIPVMHTSHFDTCLCSYCILRFFYFILLLPFLYIVNIFFICLDVSCIEGLARGSCACLENLRKKKNISMKNKYLQMFKSSQIGRKRMRKKCVSTVLMQIMQDHCFHVAEERISFHTGHFIYILFIYIYILQMF